MNNLDFFELSVAKCKMNFDFSNPQGIVVIPKEKGVDNELTKANRELIEYITAYKVVRDDDAVSKEYKEKLIYEIMRIIDTTDHINYSSFCVYFQVLRLSWNSFEDAKRFGTLSDNERAELLRNVVDLYIENRHDMYLSHGYSDVLLQVQSDCSSARRSRSIASNKLCDIMSNYNFKFASNYQEFMSGNSYFFPESNVSLLLEIMENNSIDYNFRKSRDNKNPDLMFKVNDQFYILEHKLATGDGGAQNLEINEIISFVGEDESNTNVHYISCLESNKLGMFTSVNSDLKTKTQYTNIINNLKKHPNNYFVNEFGLEEIIKSIVK